MKKQFAYAVAISALTAIPAFAQNTNFVTQATGDEWRASKLAGVNIYGQNNTKIGDVNDVVLAKDGSIKAVVIGVGGFLGIGEKNVAVPFNSIQWSSQPIAPAADRTAMTNTATPGTVATDNANSVGSANNAMGTNTTAANGVPATANGTANGTAMNNGAGTGATLDGTATPTATSTTMAANDARANAGPMDYPDHGMVNLTKDQLQNAPAFHYASEQK